MGVDSQMWAAVRAGRQHKALELVDASDESVDALTAKLDAFLNEAEASRQAAVAQLHSDGSTTRTVSVVLVDRRGPRGVRDRLPADAADLGRARAASRSASAASATTA